MLADDTFSVLTASALEGRDIFHLVSYVESNETQAKFRREIRFSAGSENLERLDELWGATAVHVDLVLDLPQKADPVSVSQNAIHAY
jgi:hypothetical protein